VQLERAGEAEAARLLKRHVEQAELLELLCALERADVDRSSEAA
jgi:hypothetical protein